MQRNNLFPSYEQIESSINMASEVIMDRVYELLGLPNPKHYNTWLEDVVLEKGETFKVMIFEFDYPDTSWICVDGKFTKFSDLPGESERQPIVGHQIILYIDPRSQKLGVGALVDEQMTIPLRFSKPQVIPFAGKVGISGNYTGSTLTFPHANDLMLGAYADQAIAPEATRVFSIASIDAPKAKEITLCPQSQDITLKNCTPTAYAYDRGADGKVIFINCNFDLIEHYTSCNPQEEYTIEGENLQKVELDGTFQFVKAPKLSYLSASEKPSTLANIEALFDSSILNNPEGDRYIALAVLKETSEQSTLPQPLEAKKAQLITLGWTITINWKTNV